MTSVAGILGGLSCAVLQSMAYIVSRHFTGSRGKSAGIALLVLMHLWLGVFALLTLPLVWTRGVPWASVAVPLVLAALFNVAGQVGLTVALHLAEPSRVSPLLTMKVFLPALLSSIVGAPVGHDAGSALSIWQWVAVLMCIGAGVSISRGGGGMKKSALAAVIFTILVFAGSDWCVGLTVGGILHTPGITSFRAALLSTAALYILTMFAGLAALPTRWGGASPERWTYALPEWRDSFPYAACWYLAMIVLFIAFGEVGVVLATILQQTRSFITILIGVGLMYAGLAHIESKQPPKVVAVRLIAGLVMFGAITLYVLGGHRDAPKPPLVPEGSVGAVK